MPVPISIALQNESTEDNLRRFVEEALDRKPDLRLGRVPFIEKKYPDWERLGKILQISSRAGQWTNFGPVSVLLESVLERYLKVHRSRAVVMCSSGTAALLTLVALKNYRAGRHLRWVISAYGFCSTRLGPLADAHVLDCDARGMLDVNALAALDPQTWDGIILTNVFGLASSIRDYIELCRNFGKELLLDNAGLLSGFPRDQRSSFVDEILSFHQTKPWGIGEGGCAILSRPDAQIFRQFTNMGKGLDQAAREGASNSKISDFSCALILQRLLQAPQWVPTYQSQARRVLRIAREIGLHPLAPLDLNRLTPPHLPLLTRLPIPAAQLENEMLVLHKYYPPLSDLASRASCIYERIVNVPCHPEMAVLTDHQISACLERVTAGCL
jgi:dTDP-4-amino-4,6-dideoxygalactose transaminase